MVLHGLEPATVRNRLATGDPLAGGRGFGGTVDGRLVTDVLGRVPVFLDLQASTVDPDSEGNGWGFDPDELTEPVVLPPGHELDLTEWSPTAGLAAATEWTTFPHADPSEDQHAAIERLRTAIEAALADSPDVPVGFSGGVDSSVLATVSSGSLYVAGVPGSHDSQAAIEAGKWLDRPVEPIELPPSTIEEAVPRVARAIGRANPMDVSIALPIWAVGRRASADGYERLLLGQGADELFGGYDKVASAPTDPRLDAETVQAARYEMIETLPGQLERDVRALRSLAVEPIVPYLDDRVIRAALKLPSETLVDDRGSRKHALRIAARGHLPDHVAFAEKTAVQYGSDVADELERLAREAGFKRRQDDHVESYIRHRVEESESG